MVTQTEVELIARHPGLVPYKECVSRAYGWGLASFSIVFAATYFGQRSISILTRIDLNKYSILTSGIIASITSFQVSKGRVAECNDLWRRRKAEESESYKNTI